MASDFNGLGRTTHSLGNTFFGVQVHEIVLRRNISSGPRCSVSYHLTSIADVTVKITCDEVLAAKRRNYFWETKVAPQDRQPDFAFFEDDFGILERRHPTINDLGQTFLPETLRQRILELAHLSKFAGHPCQTRMYRHLRVTYYWPKWQTMSIRPYELATHAIKT